MGENPERDWGRPMWGNDKPRESIRDDDKGCRMFSLIILAAILSAPLGLVVGTGMWLYS